MPEPTHVTVAATRTRCATCDRYMTLLCRRRYQTHFAQFYICWYCKRVFEAGKGEVKEDA